MGKLRKYLQDVNRVRATYKRNMKEIPDEYTREDQNIRKIEKIIQRAREYDYDEIPTAPKMEAKFGDEDADEDEEDEHLVV